MSNRLAAASLSLIFAVWVATASAVGQSGANLQSEMSGQSDAGTDSSGIFALYNISPKSYEVIATGGADLAQERAPEVPSSGDNSATTRSAEESVTRPIASRGPTVSLQQFSVPAKARAVLDKAIQSMKHGKLDEARDKVNAALLICPKFSEALTLRGLLREDASQPEEAIADFRHAIQYDANYAGAYVALAAQLNSAGRFAESLPLLNKAEQLAPSIWQVYFEVARANLGRREFAAALRNLDRASSLQGGPRKEAPEVHLLRGYALAGLMDFAPAIHELESYLAIGPRGRAADDARVTLNRLHERATTAKR
jgi:hypothetical protein